MHVGDILWITVHHWCWFVCCLGWYTDSIQFCLYVTIVLLWPELLQEDWQCAVCLELALTNINGDYYLAGCLLAVASSIGVHGNCNWPADTMRSRSQTSAVYMNLIFLKFKPFISFLHKIWKLVTWTNKRSIAQLRICCVFHYLFSYTKICHGDVTITSTMSIIYIIFLFSPTYILTNMCIKI